MVRRRAAEAGFKQKLGYQSSASPASPPFSKPVAPWYLCGS
jgi:hypothetical protein